MACVVLTLQRLPLEELRQLYHQAMDVALQVLQEEILETAAAAGNGANDNMAAIMEMVEPVKVSHSEASWRGEHSSCVTFSA
jgi:ABC-type uncharacterized transport system ATPase subunit